MSTGRWLFSIGIIVGALALSSAGDSRPASTSTRAAGPPKWRVVVLSGVPDLVAVDARTSTSVWAVGSGKGDRPVIVHWDGRKLVTRTFPWKGTWFSDVSALSENDVWAVGTADSRPLAVHFDGREWRRVALPLVETGGLAGVSAVAPDDVWAVGGVGEIAISQPLLMYDGQPLMMHFDGQEWSIVDVRKVAPRPVTLDSIDSASANDVWVFGQEGPLDDGYGFYPVLLRWDGTRWTRVHSRGSGGKGYLEGALDIARSGEIWTVQAENSGSCGGCTPQFVRWSGSSRQAVNVYSPGVFEWISDVAAVSGDDVWVVGGTHRGDDYDTFYPVIGHSNGTSWRVQRTLFSGFKDRWLNAVSAISPTEIWAVGNRLIVRYSP